MGAQRAIRCCLLLAFLTFSFTASAFAQTTIGLYTDASGSSCSFSGSDPGLMQAYVVVRPDAAGVSGVRFSAVPPACLGAIYIGETAADGMVIVGDSQAGISIAAGQCFSEPTHVLTINYFRNGSTAACCAYAIGPDPFTGLVEATTCTQATIAATPVTSHFNANGSCPCADDVAPLPPSNPFPLHETIHAFLWPTMTWSAVDWDGDIAEYDVYFGTSATPPLAVTGLPSPSWEHGPLDPLTKYYWRVVVRDALGHETSGPVWYFTTRGPNSPPIVQIISPQGPGFDPFGTLTWSASDPNGDAILFDVYLGTTSPPAFLTRVSTQSYKPPGGLLWGTHYYWRVVATDEPHSETSTPVAEFTTPPFNPPPLAPSNPSPADNATDVPLDVSFSWFASDPDDEPVTCDLQFSEVYPPQPLLAESIAPDPDGVFRYKRGAPALSENVRYYWRVIVRDSGGASTLGPVWSFVGGPDHPPTVPSLPNPPDGANVSSADVTLQWTSTDPDGHQLLYYVKFGTNNPPPNFALTEVPSKLVGPLQVGQTYYWQIVAVDGFQGTQGPVWSFTVVSPVPVLFSGFSAKVSGAAAQIDWTLRSDEAMQSYTIYRRTGDDATPLAVTSESLSGNKGSYIDRTVEGGKTYRYEMVVKTASGDEYRSQSSTVSMPVFALALEQNHPNPFNPQTTIPYTLPASNAPVRVRLIIYDASGRTVRVLVDEQQAGGAREVVWRGDNDSGMAVSSGIYFCVLQAGKERLTQKLVLLK